MIDTSGTQTILEEDSCGPRGRRGTSVEEANPVIFSLSGTVGNTGP